MMMLHPVVNDIHIGYGDVYPVSGDSMTEVDWTERAKGLLKGELKRRGVSYRDLAVKLGEIGIHETERNIANKISRGGFTGAFLIQCLTAIGATTLRLDD